MINDSLLWSSLNYSLGNRRSIKTRECKTVSLRIRGVSKVGRKIFVKITSKQASALNL